MNRGDSYCRMRRFVRSRGARVMPQPIARIANDVTPLISKRGRSARAPATTPKLTRIYLLGQMRALGHTGNDLLPRAKKVQAIFAYLCLARGEHLSRSRIAGVVWDRSG